VSCFLAVTAIVVVFAGSTSSALGAGRGEGGPVFPVEIVLADRVADLAQLTRMGIDIDGVFGQRARAYVIQEEFEKLTLLGFVLTPLPEEPEEAATAAPGATYHTYATLTSELHTVGQDHPSIARLYSIGKSVQGRDLWMMKITRNPDASEDEPAVHYIAAMHGDEVVGKENCINLINLLTDSYGVDSRITNLVDSTEIWILPSMNPDGTELRRRYNVNGYDLNRNFPDRIQDPTDTPAGRQPETAAVMDWRSAHSSVLSANFHGGTVVANYPWDGNAEYASVYTASPDDSVFVSIARTYADNNPSMRTSNSDSSYDNGICNGADWYVVYGGMQDWSYVWRGGQEVTLEISQVKWPSADQLPAFWDQNRESMLAYLERVHAGVRGIITDARTGAPLAATVRVVGIDHSVYTDPAVGDYHRLLLPGLYTLEVSAPGYNTTVVESVLVGAGAPPTRKNVALEPLAVDLQHASHRVLDGDGGNGELDPGESADLAVTLRDLGIAATRVSARLEPTGWFGNVARAEAFFPDIQTGGYGESLAPHHAISLAGTTPAGHKAGFALRWSTDQGSGTAGPFFIPAGTPACTVASASDLPKTILDRQTATSVLSFPADREISSVRVRVDLTHTYVSDLTVTAISPAGTPVILHNHAGGSSDDLHLWYPTDRAPAEPLGRMAGEQAGGTWTLRVRDTVPANTGTLDGWSIEVCGRPFEASTPEMRFREFDKSPEAVLLRWWPYPGLTSYRVFRSADPSVGGSFLDVTTEDPDNTDNVFEDHSTGERLYWLVSGVGPRGEGPRGSAP
jgi:carboxypeptidase D